MKIAGRVAAFALLVPTSSFTPTRGRILKIATPGAQSEQKGATIASTSRTFDKVRHQAEASSTVSETECTPGSVPFSLPSKPFVEEQGRPQAVAITGHMPHNTKAASGNPRLEDTNAWKYEATNDANTDTTPFFAHVLAVDATEQQAEHGKQIQSIISAETARKSTHRNKNNRATDKGGRVLEGRTKRPEKAKSLADVLLSEINRTNERILQQTKQALSHAEKETTEKAHATADATTEIVAKAETEHKSLPTQAIDIIYNALRNRETKLTEEILRVLAEQSKAATVSTIKTITVMTIAFLDLVLILAAKISEETKMTIEMKDLARHVEAAKLQGNAQEKKTRQLQTQGTPSAAERLTRGGAHSFMEERRHEQKESRVLSAQEKVAAIVASARAVVDGKQRRETERKAKEVKAILTKHKTIWDQMMSDAKAEEKARLVRAEQCRAEVEKTQKELEVERKMKRAEALKARRKSTDELLAKDAQTAEEARCLRVKQFHAAMAANAKAVEVAKKRVEAEYQSRKAQAESLRKFQEETFQQVQAATTTAVLAREMAEAERKTRQMKDMEARLQYTREANGTRTKK